MSGGELGVGLKLEGEFGVTDVNAPSPHNGRVQVLPLGCPCQIVKLFRVEIFLSFLSQAECNVK